MTTRVVTAHLPEELANKLDGLAQQLDRPRGWLVKEALQAYVDLAEERRQETIAALKEIDAGQVVEHEEVETWAAELGKGRGRKSRVRRGA